jgi:hypothetical protein
MRERRITLRYPPYEFIRATRYVPTHWRIPE